MAQITYTDKEALIVNPNPEINKWTAENANEVKDAHNDLESKFSAGAVSSGFANGVYDFSTTITEADPGAGFLRLNNASFASVTKVFLDDLTRDGIDIGSILSRMTIGDSIRIQLSSDVDNYASYILTQLPTDNTGWWTLEVSYLVSSGSLFANNADVVATVLFNGALASSVTRDINRAWTDTLIFNRHEITYVVKTMDDDITYTLGGGNLIDQFSSARQRIIADGVHAIFFGDGFDYRYGITNGQILEAGNYEIYFLHINGSITVNVPGVSQQSSGITQLLTPSDFAVVADGENALDMSWSDVANESSYQIERSLTGTGGWTLYSNPAANATSDTETGLNPGDTVYYRIKAVGDGVTYSDSPYTIASGTTEDAGDVTAPTFTFNPVNGSSIWPVNKPFTITANEAMRKDDGTPLEDNDAGIITLKQTNSGGSDIAHTWTIDASKTIITITPTTTLGTNQLVYVAINNVEDVSGNESSLTSITFTTTAYTFFNGTSNRLVFGDILDSLFAVNDTNFWLELTVNNGSLSGSRTLHAKLASSAQTFRLYYNNTSVIFYYAMGASKARTILWTGTDMSSAEHTIVLKYDGSIDTNDGLDRCELLIDGVTQTGAVLSNPTGSLTGTLSNTTSQLSLGIAVNNAGTPNDTLWFSGEAKDMKIRSASGSVVELNIPVLLLGTDSSGNGRNGTWV